AARPGGGLPRRGQRRRRLGDARPPLGRPDAGPRARGRGVDAAQLVSIGAAAVPGPRPRPHRLRGRLSLSPPDARRRPARRPPRARAAAPPARPHRPRRHSAPLPPPQTPPPAAAPPLLPIPPNAEDRARRAFAAAGLPGGAPLVLLAPGAAFGPTKQWPAKRF